MPFSKNRKDAAKIQFEAKEKARQAQMQVSLLDVQAEIAKNSTDARLLAKLMKKAEVRTIVFCLSLCLTPSHICSIGIEIQAAIVRFLGRGRYKCRYRTLIAQEFVYVFGPVRHPTIVVF